jgi:SAM-dependent methyltransferase
MSDATEPGDERNAIYRHLHADQLSREKVPAEYSSRRALEILFKVYRPQSVLDVGCGLGNWLKTALDLGVSEVKGLEGAWVDQALLEVPPDLVEIRDLEKPFDLERKFDLAISLEVAEHLSAAAADGFVASLVRHAPAVLFSAALPFQGGDHHVNEQFLPYWAAKFAQHGYQPVDLIRKEIWEDAQVLLWLRQNLMLFAHDDLIAANEDLRRAKSESHFPFTVVHPEFYFRRAKEVDGILNLLRQEGFYQVNGAEKAGDFRITRVTDVIKPIQQLVDIMKGGGYFRASVADVSGDFSVTKADENIAEMENLREYMQSGGLFQVTPGKSPGDFSVAKASATLEDLQTLRDFIAKGGLFRVTVDASGALSVSKVDEAAGHPKPS